MSKTTRSILIIVAVIIIMGLVLAWILGAFRVETAVTGEIISSQPILLPRGAKVTVSITNASLVDAPTNPVGEQILNYALWFPIPYEVIYNPDDIDERLNYSIGVRIIDPFGNLIYISDTATPVITNGNPTEDVAIHVVQVGR